MSRPRIYKTEGARKAARKAAQARYNKRLGERTVCLQARVSPELAKRVDEVVEASGLTRADWLRETIERVVGRKKGAGRMTARLPNLKNRPEITRD